MTDGIHQSTKLADSRADDDVGRVWKTMRADRKISTKEVKQKSGPKFLKLSFGGGSSTANDAGADLWGDILMGESDVDLIGASSSSGSSTESDGSDDDDTRHRKKDKRKKQKKTRKTRSSRNRRRTSLQQQGWETPPQRRKPRPGMVKRPMPASY